MSERIEISQRTSFEDTRSDSQHAVKHVLSSSSRKEKDLNGPTSQFVVLDDNASTDLKVMELPRPGPSAAATKVSAPPDLDFLFILPV